MARTCFVTATDTGVGKTVLTAAIAAGLVAAGGSVRARKPILTGARPAVDAERSEDLRSLDDHVLLAAITGEDPGDVAFATYEPAVSPHLAAELSGAPLDVRAIVDELRRVAAATEALVVEGIGGLLVPLADGWDVRALAAALDWPVLIAARPGLGTLNHTLLTLEAARGHGLNVAAVVLTPWPTQPDAIERSNRETIARLGAVEVATLEDMPVLTREALARAAVTLGYDRWLTA